MEARSAEQMTVGENERQDALEQMHRNWHALEHGMQRAGTRGLNVLTYIYIYIYYIFTYIYLSNYIYLS